MKEREYAIFWGCTTLYREQSYEISTRSVLQELDIGLLDVNGLGCCGLPILPLDEDAAITMAVRNLYLLAQTERPILTICNGCYKMFRDASRRYEDEEFQKIFEEKLGIEKFEIPEIYHIVEILSDEDVLEEIKSRKKREIGGMRIAGHSGCHFYRPKKDLSKGDPERPQELRRIVEALGGEYVEYWDETECCGATVALIDLKLPLEIVREKVLNMERFGADSVVTMCPSCHMMLDLYQRQALRDIKGAREIPVLHITQLVGLFLGLSPDELGLHLNKVKLHNVIVT